MKLGFLLLAGIVVLAAGCGAAATPPAVGLNPGDLFPPIMLPSLRDRKPMSLAEFRGKKVLLHIFASW